MNTYSKHKIVTADHTTSIIKYRILRKQKYVLH